MIKLTWRRINSKAIYLLRKLIKFFKKLIRKDANSLMKTHLCHGIADVFSGTKILTKNKFGILENAN